ncbi:MAG TPA: pyridoxamine 5'-phosphate oxidase family protein, partial [Bacteroidales bacterium]|nr:pyridoxamine 5'-phosphate oxidase family protein [Bacteroidales bacterium]
EIYRFLTDHPLFALATADGAVPHVRMLMLHKADDSGIYFMVGKLKEVYRQLSMNPKVELCFSSENFQVRITGEAENLDRDQDLKKEVAEARPFLKIWIEKFGLKYMAVFRVKNGVATTWSLETELQPKRLIQL